MQVGRHFMGYILCLDSSGMVHICSLMVSAARSDRKSLSSIPGRAQHDCVILVEIVSYW